MTASENEGNHHQPDVAAAVFSCIKERRPAEVVSCPLCYCSKVVVDDQVSFCEILCPGNRHGQTVTTTRTRYVFLCGIWSGVSVQTLVRAWTNLSFVCDLTPFKK